MNKEAFHKKWYYRLLQVIFWGSLIPILGALILFSILGILGIYEEDIPMAGLFWAGVIVLIYWLVKRIFYYVMFGERILSKKLQSRKNRKL
jgi:membrane protease YdiL (CAAX protease family)